MFRLWSPRRRYSTGLGIQKVTGLTPRAAVRSGDGAADARGIISASKRDEKAAAGLRHRRRLSLVGMVRGPQ
jgi:hypothetical protein